MVFYISVAATQIIPLVIRTEGLSLSAAGWIFGFCTPVLFNMLVLQQILAKCVLLRAVYELDADVAGMRDITHATVLFFACVQTRVVIYPLMHSLSFLLCC